ncbi:MAG: hypothetical protein MH321_12165 [Leptospiraceae bacterium]|nr:hypothetical protein [Leptospiraceae bacterium]
MEELGGQAYGKEKLNENYSPKNIILMSLGTLKYSILDQFKSIDHNSSTNKIKLPTGF